MDASEFPKDLVDHFIAKGAMEFGFLQRVVTNSRAVDVIQTQIFFQMLFWSEFLLQFCALYQFVLTPRHIAWHSSKDHYDEIETEKVAHDFFLEDAKESVAVQEETCLEDCEDCRIGLF